MGWVTNWVLNRLENSSWLTRADIARRLTKDMTFVSNASGDIIPAFSDKIAACNGSQIKYIMRDDEYGNEVLDQTNSV